MTILESLKSLSNYPVPQRTINTVAVRRGLTLTTEATAIVLNSTAYRLAEADIEMWLVAAPTIAEGGVSFGLSQTERDRLRQDASMIYSEINGEVKSPYGYKGENL